MRKLNIVFAGTADISAKILKDLYELQHNIQAVFTQPDKAKSRGRNIQYSPVKKIALKNNIPVFQPSSLKKNPIALTQLKKLNPDVVIVLAYGIIFPKEFLNVPRYGCLNIHVSLLPRWRGAAPIQRAIQAGDKKTGICIMQMDESLDTGNILNSLEIDIQDDDTSESLHNKFARLAVDPLLKTLENIDIIEPKAQCGQPTYAHKITKKEGLINFNNTAWQISCHIRAFIMWPSAFFMLDGQAIKVGEFEILEQLSNKKAGIIFDVSKCGFDATSSDKIIRFKQLQFPNKKMLSVADILNGKDLSKYIGYEIG